MIADIAIETAKNIRSQHGGTIFAFPVDMDNPMSKYSIVVYTQGSYFVYPQTPDIEEAAVGVLTLLEEFKKQGLAKDFDNDVRMIANNDLLGYRPVNMLTRRLLN